MAINDFNAQRLFVNDGLAAGVAFACSEAQSNYLRNVLRLGSGAEIRVFNGSDGEWLARLTVAGKRGCSLEPLVRLREQEGGPASTTWCRRRRNSA